MKYLHTMVRVSDVDKSLDFYCKQLGLVETRRYDSEQGRFTLIFLAAPGVGLRKRVVDFSKRREIALAVGLIRLGLRIGLRTQDRIALFGHPRRS